MERLKRLDVPLGVLAVALAASTAANAQIAGPSASSPQSPQTNAPITEVIVTASKRAENIRNVPMGVTAIGGVELNEKQALSFADLAALVPGLSFQQEGTGFNRIIIRGENAGTTGATVGVYVDDSPIGSTNGPRSSTLTANLDTWDLQRVEVLRGPQGTLYGASTEGGLIKFVSNSPNPSKFEGAIEAGAEVVKSGEATGSVKGVLNLPLFDGRGAFRISGFDEALPGYIDDPALGLHNVNHGIRKGLRAALIYDPTDKLSLKLTASIQDQTSAGLPYEDAIGSALTYAAPPLSRFSPSDGDLRQNRYIAESTKSQIENFSLAANWDLGFATASSITSYSIIRLSDVEDYTSAEVAPGFTYGDILTQFIYGVPSGLAEYNSNRVGKVSQEFRLVSRSSGNIQWQAGVFYTRERTTAGDRYLAFQIPPNAPQGGDDQGRDHLSAAYNEVAGFGELTYKLNPRFDVTLGARYSYNTQTNLTSQTSSPLLGPASATPASSSGDAFTYSFAPRWHLTDNTLVYARIASGFRPGGPNTEPLGAPANVPKTYKSDATVNYELGIRSSLFDHRVSVDIDAFYIDWSNVQVFEVVNATGITGNGGGARSDGVEWNLGYKPARGLSFALVGSYIDAIITQDAPFAGAPKGERLPYVPRVTNTLDAEYRWAIAGGWRAYFGGDVSYFGSQYTDFGASAIFEPHAKLPDYTTINLRAGINWKSWQSEFYIKNLTNERGITSYSNTGTPSRGGSIGIIQPTTFGLRLTKSFS